MPSRLNTAKPARWRAGTVLTRPAPRSGASPAVAGRQASLAEYDRRAGGQAAGHQAAGLQTAGRQSAGQHAGGPQALSGIGLTVILVGVLLPMLDFFIVNVALPTIDADLRASQPMLELVVSGYASAYALLLVLGGRLGDSLGRKRLFLIGMAAFTLTSLACGLAPDAVALVAGRIAQGASAAMMVPQVLATIQAATTGDRRARALGRYGATGGLAAVLGQVVGGLLISANIDSTGWRPIFLVNVPIGLVGLVLANRYVPDTRHGNAARIDGRGTILLGLTVLALLIPLTEGRSLGWPDWSIALLAATPLFAAAFGLAELRMERRGHTPLIPPSLLRHTTMRRGLLLALPFFAGFGAFMFCYALLVQQGLHDSALAAGIGLVPMAAPFLLASLSTSRLIPRFGAKVLAAGALLQALGLAVLILTVNAGWPGLSVAALAPGLAIAGFGQGLVMSPLFGVVLSEVPPASAGAGSGVLTTTQQTALALGVATLGSMFLTLADDGTGVRVGFIVVLAIQIVIAFAVAGGARRLPSWRRRAPAAPGLPAEGLPGEGPSAELLAAGAQH
jgi:EmrB/QacA subfamily drug resistance transporter